MFSGLTNQVSSWMGSAKGEQEEKIPTPTEDPSNPDGSGSILEKKEGATSPTKHSKLEMFSNVKGHIEGIGGWIGSSIPKLRKGDAEAASAATSDEPSHQAGGEDAADGGGASGTAAETTATKHSTREKTGGDDDDNSSATGGADSGPASAAESPTEEGKEGQFGNVQSKALAGAKSFGSFLYSAVNKAGAKVSEASAKVKEAVEKNSILGDFNKEQEAFAKNQAANAANALPPWTGCSNEEALKEECLSLSTDKRNFVRSPPAGVEFNFEISYPVAMSIMEQDPNLEKMRYELVPKVITEEEFWRNYFYRVSLICQANELSFMSREGDNQSADAALDQLTLENKANEFVSDTLQVTSQDLVEVKEGMKKLALGSKTTEEEWEKELEAELQDYEVVSEHKSSSSKNDNWEQEIDDILDDEEDLK